ncbi:MAG: response regulator transcription factor [Verrucomicrobia bacterium]|nr:response regulator transcription factor [Verrucomicrobiota bacterium]MDA1005071.1 response regulator transcription factor [Verrucomicrobiota bacterium]
MTTTSSEKPTDVWLVEDNVMFGLGVQRVVNSLAGMTCGGNFTSVEAAFAALEGTAAPDVILLDVQLPGMDGIEALGSFKVLAPDARIIILTVFDDADKIFRAVCAGASGYVLKSAGIDQIGAAIKQVMAGGAPMTPEVARKVLDAFARIETISENQESPDDYHLTDRELAILRLMADGLLKKEIAAHMEISIHTVSTHLRRVYCKLHVNTNTGAVAKALREGII